MRASLTGITALGGLLLAIAAAGCGSQDPADPAFPRARTAPDAVHVEGRTFRDGQGRQLLFRGDNAKFAPLFDVVFADGRTPTEAFPEFAEADAARYEELGLDVMRLPVSWSALEPEPKQYSAAFFDKLDQVLALAAAHHFYVFIDMHQDAYSKEIGEDGAPLWAIVPAPTELLSGPYDDARRTSDQVLAAGFSFFDNAPATDGRPLQDAFVAAVQQIVKHVVGNPVVLGYEAFNEPVVLSPDKLDQFHQRFADGVHAIDKDAPVLFEPLATRNQADAARLPAEPWSNGPGAYAPHIYTAWFSRPDQNNWASEDPAALEPSMLAADAEAAAWGTPLFITEFGCDQSIDRGPKWIAAELDLQDRLLASSTAWIWAENGSWGLRDAGDQERPASAKTIARPYPRAVAGDLISIEHPDAGHLLVRYRATLATRGLPNEVSVSAAAVTNIQILCDGAPVDVQAATGRASFVCPVTDDGEHTFEVVGTPAP